jgi:Coenzyme PQQ synthesis protein D (PqqD)
MLAISRTIRRTRTEDGAMLLDVQTGRILCLNVIGSMIMDRIEAGEREEQIVECLRSEYGDDLGTVRTDVRDFLEDLRRHEVLEDQDPLPRESSERANGRTDAT